MTADLVIRGGTVVDGTGAPPVTADVAVTDGVIVEVGAGIGAGRREIDADGAFVLPGFVDIHTHYDGQAMWDQRLQPSSWHGVTTVVMGNCGVGFAPVESDDRDRLVALMEGIEDIPGAALHEGLDWNWRSFPDFLDALERRPHDVDFAAQLPHAPLRVKVMGDRAIAGRDATPEEAAEMARLARIGVEAGALGFTTSRSLNHRSVDGTLTPSYDAGAAELTAIAAQLGACGRGVLQMVTDYDDLDADFALMRAMARSGRPLSVSLAQLPAHPERFREVLRRISLANEEGLRMHAQVAVRSIGVLLGLPCTLHPFRTNPVWQRIETLPLDAQARAMRDPDFRRAVLDAQRREPVSAGTTGGFVSAFDAMYEMRERPDYEPDPAQSLLRRAERAGVRPEELAYDVMAQGDGAQLLFVFVANFADGNLDAVREMLAHPYTLPGLSDGGAHVGIISDGSFPTTLLQLWARERERGRLPLEHVVQRQCRDTARKVELHDRGVVAPGYRADLNVVDLESVRVLTPELHYDLPGGGKRLLQKADGYLHTFVAGVETYRSGEPTGALPGRLVRGRQPAPA